MSCTVFFRLIVHSFHSVICCRAEVCSVTPSVLHHNLADPHLPLVWPAIIMVMRVMLMMMMMMPDGEIQMVKFKQ